MPPIDPLSAAAIFGHVASGIFGLGSTSSTNRTNLQIARENREFNAQMMREQNAYNTEMWNKNNAYNTPLAQRQRLEEAGINPYALLNGTGSGMSSAVSSAPFQSSQMPEMRAPDFSFVSQIANSALSAQSISLDNENKRINNNMLAEQSEFNRMKILGDLSEQSARISEMLANKNLSDETRENLIRHSELIDRTMSYMVDEARLRPQEQQANINRMQAEAENQYAQVARVAIEKALAASNIRLNNQTIRRMASEMAKLQHEIYEIDSRTDLNEANKDAIIEYKSKRFWEGQRERIGYQTDAKKFNNLQRLLDDNHELNDAMQFFYYMTPTNGIGMPIFDSVYDTYFPKESESSSYSYSVGNEKHTKTNTKQKRKFRGRRRR